MANKKAIFKSVSLVTLDNDFILFHMNLDNFQLTLIFRKVLSLTEMSLVVKFWGN